MEWSPRIYPDDEPQLFVLLLVYSIPVARQGGKRAGWECHSFLNTGTLVIKYVFKGTAFLDLWDYSGLWEYRAATIEFEHFLAIFLVALH